MKIHLRFRWLAALSMVFMSGLPGPVHGQWIEHDEYRIDPDEAVEVYGQHFRNWTLRNIYTSGLQAPVGQSGLFEWDQGVQLRHFSNRRNAAATATQLRYPDFVRAGGDTVSGGAEARSNSPLAPNAIDGDLSTYWEPAEKDFHLDGILNWELIVDLGQLVLVDSITVYFPSGELGEHDRGDPPISFGVLGGLGNRSREAPGVTTLRYASLGTATAAQLVPAGPDNELRKITFPVDPILAADLTGDGLPNMSGSFLHYIMVKILSSDLDTKELLGSGEEGRLAYEALPPERRGRKVYRRFTVDGGTVRLDSSVYYDETRLPVHMRAPVQYYMRELPRVLQVEVWTQGDNVMYQPRSRGGGAYEKGGVGNPIDATDGLFMTWWTAYAWSPTWDRGLIWYDLGATFWVNRLSFALNQFPFLGHHVNVSDGTLVNPVRMTEERDFVQLEDALAWDNVVDLDNRDSRALMITQKFSLRPVRFLQVRNQDPTGERFGMYAGTAYLSELQAYGDGFPVSAQVESGPVRIQRQEEDIRAALTRISWDAEAVVRRPDPDTGEMVEMLEPLYMHPEVTLDIQTRTSDTADTSFAYFAVVRRGDREIRRTALTRQEYEDLVANPNPRVGEPMMEAELEFTGWSGWSAPYRPTGGVDEAIVTSPSPRRFLQFRVTLGSENPNKTALLRSITVDLDRPLSLNTAAELAVLSPQGRERPVSDYLGVVPEDYREPVGISGLRPQSFAYFLRAAGPDPEQFRAFDEIRIQVGAAVTLRGVRVGAVDVDEVEDPLNPDVVLIRPREGASRFTDFFEPAGEERVFRNPAGQSLQLLSPAGADELRMRFPYAINAEAEGTRHALVEVQFDAHVVRQGAVFPGFVRDSSVPDSPFQRVEVDQVDATALASRRSASLELEHLDALIHELQMPTHVTPNSGGLNDRLDIRFILLHLMQDRPVEVRIHDLSGRQVGEAVQQAGEGSGTGGTRMGEVRFTWDARDSSGTLVPPGLYVAVIQVKADDPETVTRSFAVVY